MACPARRILFMVVAAHGMGGSAVMHVLEGTKATSSPYQIYQTSTLGLSQYFAATRFDAAKRAAAMFPEQG
ncbi:hypothetical protein KP509_07G008000 [Ceratopteris richardii]|uniref:Uncharacterized protein n=2 Tax=Ceratopteris richardii TaxID=49495 RepID=A0A8T2SMQ4_CERRI|nr:hypothetical protein KP509_19G005100 [Ceratopteris richardii]KAH7352154.1 hypothetical protein KP509_19G032300 [Ceratopteris richardii]KAH7432095.1 hypothetical protein KP509_07G008000 [Ceratopteris richardii]